MHVSNRLRYVPPSTVPQPLSELSTLCTEGNALRRPLHLVTECTFTIEVKII